MPFAINLTLDQESALAVDGALARLATLGVADRDMITQYGACVTLLVVDDTMRADRLADLLRTKVGSIAAIEIELADAELYPSTPPSLGLRVTEAKRLLEAHQTIFRLFPEDSVDARSAPAHWRPHVRLARARGRDQDRRRLLDATSERWRPRRARLDRLELMRYMPVQSVWWAPLCGIGRPAAASATF